MRDSKYGELRNLTLKDGPENDMGDCYIILHTYKIGRSDKLNYNVHFWLGRKSTQDERGTAAYKTVELDDLLGTMPVQHREVMGFESDLFMSYFKDRSITIMKGGIASGFRHVEPEKYEPRLFHIKGKRRVICNEVVLSIDSLNLGDAFVLDNGLRAYAFLPRKSGATEKFRANMMLNKIKMGRKDAETWVLDDDGVDVKTEEHPEFWELLGGKKRIKDASEYQLDEIFDKMAKEGIRTMYRLTDKEDMKNVKFEKVCERKLDKKLLKTSDVYIIDVGNEILVWIGKKTSKKVRSESVLYAQNYMGLYKKPVWLPITRVCEGRETQRFWDLFTGQSGGGRTVVAKPKRPKKEHTLKIFVYSCSDLRKADKGLEGSKADPYVEFCIGDQHEQATSAVKKKCLNPTFNENLTIKFWSYPETSSLKVRVFDKDKFSKDDNLGKLDIPLMLLPKGKKLERTFKLRSVKTGDIRLALTAVDFGSTKSQDVQVKTIMPTLMVNLEEGFFDVSIKKEIIPYVIFKLGNQEYRSSVLEKEKNTKWKENYAFRLNEKHPDQEVLYVKVKCANTFLPDETLGTTMIPVSLLPYNKVISRKVALYKKNLETPHSLTLTLRTVDFGTKNEATKPFY